MIYAYPGISDPVRQGDIFARVPLTEISLDKILIPVSEGSDFVVWDEVSDHTIAAIVGIKPIIGIVVTQDCDVVRSRDITLCEVRDFKTVEGKAANAQSARSWVSIICQHARMNLKWFYLPEDTRMSFTRRMGVDFRVTTRIKREDLEGLRKFRLGRLNELACEHFRTRLSEFYRRYAYDEWYPLDKGEMDYYQQNRDKDAKRFPWQL